MVKDGDALRHLVSFFQTGFRPIQKLDITFPDGVEHIVDDLFAALKSNTRLHRLKLIGG